jgi:hypothetical protein
LTFKHVTIYERCKILYKYQFFLKLRALANTLPLDPCPQLFFHLFSNRVLLLSQAGLSYNFPLIYTFNVAGMTEHAPVTSFLLAEMASHGHSAKAGLNLPSSRSSLSGVARKDYRCEPPHLAQT